MNKTFPSLAFTKKTALYSSSRVKYPTMPKQHQQSQSSDTNTSSAGSCLYCITKTIHPRLGRGETYICGYKPYRCEICNYSTTTKGNLAIHQQSDKHLNNLQEHEQTLSQTIFNSVDNRSSQNGSTDYECHQQQQKQQNILHQSRQYLNSSSKKPSPVSDLNILTSQSLNDMRSVKALQQNTKLEHKSIVSLQNRSGNDETEENMKMNTTVGNLYEMNLSKNKEINNHFNCTSSSSFTTSTALLNSFSLQHNLSLNTFTPSTLSYGNPTYNLTETSNHPLACQVCCTFTTNNLDTLIEHAERNRIPFDLDYVTNLITVHTNGFWFCKLCSYKSPLKANFQLHCKTEKHAQRLSFLVHVCEGGLWNQSRILSTLNIQESQLLNGNNNNIQFSLPNRLNCNLSLSSAMNSLATHSNITGDGSSSNSNNNVKNNFNLTSSIQLYCIACDLYTTSVHKFRLHCQTGNHAAAVKTFTHLVNRRNYLWNTLASLSLFYVDLLKSLTNDDNNNNTDNSESTQTNRDSSLPISQDVNKLNYQTKFSKVLLQLSSILTNLQVVYAFHKKHLPLTLPLPNFSSASPSSSSSSSSANINFLLSDKSQKYVNRFKTLTSALRHWHTGEHRKTVFQQQMSGEHNMLQHHQQHNASSESVYQFEEISDVYWQLGDMEGEIEELPTVITKILTPLIDDSMNKHFMKYNTSTNGFITETFELSNPMCRTGVDSDKSSTKNLPNSASNNSDQERFQNKMETSEVSPFQYSKFNAVSNQYQNFNEIKQQMNNDEFRLLITEAIGQQNVIPQNSQLFKFNTYPSTSANIIPAGEVFQDGNLLTSFDNSEAILNTTSAYDSSIQSLEKCNKEVTRCHSEENNPEVQQRLPRKWFNFEKDKSRALSESDTFVTLTTTATAGPAIYDWPIRPNSEPILKPTNHLYTESGIDLNKKNIYKAKTYQNLTDPTRNNQQFKSSMTANAFLPPNRTIEGNVPTDCLYMSKDLRLTDKWKNIDKHPLNSNMQHMSSDILLPNNSYGLCGAPVTPMELFSQMTAHYKNISENFSYGQSMGLLLSSAASSTHTAHSIGINTSESITSSPPLHIHPAAHTSTPASTNLELKQQISSVHSPSSHKTINIDDFFHEVNVIPNLHSLLKKPLEIMLYGNISNMIQYNCSSENLLAFTLECIANYKSQYDDIYKKFNNIWFKLDHLSEVQLLKGSPCKYCRYVVEDDNNNSSNSNVDHDADQKKIHRFILESSMGLHKHLQHSTSSTDEGSTPPSDIFVPELIRKLNTLFSNPAISNLFILCSEGNYHDMHQYKEVSSDALDSLSVTKKHFQSDNSKELTTHMDTNETELNDTDSPASFATEQKYIMNNYSAADDTTSNAVGSTYDSNTPLFSSIIQSDQINLLNRDLETSLTNLSSKIISNSVCFDKSDVLSNYATNTTNNIVDNDVSDIDSKMHLPLADTSLNSIKDYNMNDSTNLLHKLYLKAQQEQHKLFLQHGQQQNLEQQNPSGTSQKRSRTRLSETQLSILRSYFDISNSPSDEKIREICVKTGLQEKVVKHWFRNTLFKERQKNKDNPYNFAIPPSTSLNLEEYEKTGRIEVHSTMSMKPHNQQQQEQQKQQQFYSNGEQYNKQISDDSLYESNSSDVVTSNVSTTTRNHTTHLDSISYTKNSDKTCDDSYMIPAHSVNEYSNIKSPNSSIKQVNSTVKRSCEIELSSFTETDNTKSHSHHKRSRLNEDSQSLSMNDEMQESVLPTDEKDMIQNYKRNSRSTESSTENVDGDTHSFAIVDNSNNSQESPPSITSESSPSISEAPLSPRIPFVPDLDNPQSVIAALIRLGNHNQIQQQQPQYNQRQSIYDCENRLNNLWELQYLPSSVVPCLTNNNDMYTDTSKLHYHIAALMNASMATSLSKFQTTSESNEAPLDLSSKTSLQTVINSGDDNICKTDLSSNEHNIHAADNEVNNDCNAVNQDSFVSMPSLIQTERVSSVYHSTSTTSSSNGGRRNRTSITALQSRCMHSIYNYHKTPSVHECDRLGEIIGLSRRVVQVWFQNQRAKEKKMARVTSGQFGFSVNSSPTITEKLSPTDTSSMDSNYCHICSVSIQKSDLSSNTGFINQQMTNSNSQSGSFVSHASFVDHLFSPIHLKKLIRWCTMDTS
ncbi:unnamed protein product [Trichobilharzia szidati]|nr:unnamed protein product [Trichobilharzia szidati]